MSNSSNKGGVCFCVVIIVVLLGGGWWAMSGGLDDFLQDVRTYRASSMEQDGNTPSIPPKVVRSQCSFCGDFKGVGSQYKENTMESLGSDVTCASFEDNLENLISEASSKPIAPDAVLLPEQEACLHAQALGSLYCGCPVPRESQCWICPNGNTVPRRFLDTVVEGSGSDGSPPATCADLALIAAATMGESQCTELVELASTTCGCFEAPDPLPTAGDETPQQDWENNSHFGSVVTHPPSPSAPVPKPPSSTPGDSGISNTGTSRLSTLAPTTLYRNRGPSHEKSTAICPLCWDGSFTPLPDKVAYNDRDGTTVTCHEFELRLDGRVEGAEDADRRAQLCLGGQVVGAVSCGCPVPSEKTCWICPDGRTTPKDSFLKTVVRQVDGQDVTCMDLALMASVIDDEAACVEQQRLGVELCGCPPAPAGGGGVFLGPGSATSQLPTPVPTVDVDKCTVCADGSSPPKPNNVVIETANGARFTCGQLELQLGSLLESDPDQRDAICQKSQVYGSLFCECPLPTPDEMSCWICEGPPPLGRSKPNMATIRDIVMKDANGRDSSCVDMAEFAATLQNKNDCSFFRESVAGSTCGCPGYASSQMDPTGAPTPPLAAWGLGALLPRKTANPTYFRSPSLSPPSSSP